MIAGIWSQAGKAFADDFASDSQMTANSLTNIVSCVEKTLQNVLPHYVNLVQVLGAFQATMKLW